MKTPRFATTLFGEQVDPLTRLQAWYHSQCDGDWEHSYGIKIGNLDNPGWEVEIDLCETELENVEFPEFSYGVGDQADSSGDDWMICKRIENKFDGCGGPHKLSEILEHFLQWANNNKKAEQGGDGDAEEAV